MIGVELDIDRLLAKILDAAFQLLPADRGVVLLYDEARELKPRCVRTKQAHASQEDVILSTTIIEEVLRDKAAVLSSDASVDSRFQQAHSIIMQGIRSTMGVPLLHGGEVFGIMMLDSQIAANAFTEKDLQLFQNVANQAAIAVQEQPLRPEAQAGGRDPRALSAPFEPGHRGAGHQRQGRGEEGRRVPRDHRALQRHPRLHFHEPKTCGRKRSSTCSTTTSS